jgi:hypothetical protein
LACAKRNAIPPVLPEPFTTHVHAPPGGPDAWIRVNDADGDLVAEVQCVLNRPLRYGTFGSIIIYSNPPAGPDRGYATPRQRVRLAVLLVRRALRFAEEIGLQHVDTWISPHMRDFTKHLTGTVDDPTPRAGGPTYVEADLHDVATRIRERSDDAGHLLRAPDFVLEERPRG